MATTRTPAGDRAHLRPQGLSEGKNQVAGDSQPGTAQATGRLCRAEFPSRNAGAEPVECGAVWRRPGAVFQGISTKYGITPQKLNSTPSSDQQAALLLKRCFPQPAPTTDGRPELSVQQSGGLAASVAGLFFGNPVALAAGARRCFRTSGRPCSPTRNFARRSRRLR